jgi:hypothetical protein
MANISYILASRFLAMILFLLVLILCYTCYCHHLRLTAPRKRFPWGFLFSIEIAGISDSWGYVDPRADCTEASSRLREGQAVPEFLASYRPSDHLKWLFQSECGKIGKYPSGAQCLGKLPKRIHPALNLLGPANWRWVCSPLAEPNALPPSLLFL